MEAIHSIKVESEFSTMTEKPQGNETKSAVPPTLGEEPLTKTPQKRWSFEVNQLSTSSTLLHNAKPASQSLPTSPILYTSSTCISSPKPAQFSFLSPASAALRSLKYDFGSESECPNLEELATQSGRNLVDQKQFHEKVNFSIMERAGYKKAFKSFGGRKRMSLDEVDVRVRNVFKTGEAKIICCLTRSLEPTYRLCNSAYPYSKSAKPRRSLSKPSEGVKNEGYDNANSDYILFVNDILGDKEGQKFRIIELLGQGTFGQVVKCVNIKTKQVVAIKVIKNKPAYFNQSMVELNSKYDPTDSNHIARIYDTFIFRKHLCLVFEPLSVNLYELVKQNQFRGFSTSLVRVFSAQILQALIILNDAKIVHCDLKPENILLKNLQTPAIKVIDFGSACFEHQTVFTYIQSRFYRSPEVLLGLPYSSSIDMWSTGCILVELFLGLPLFPGSSEFNQICRIVEMLGMPPTYMLEFGKNSPLYFNKIFDPSSPKHKFELKSLTQFNNERNTDEKPSKRYFKGTNLKDLIMRYPLSKRLATKEEIDRELHNREVFYDFVSGLLNINPLERWSPQQGKLHPFITKQPWTGPYRPRMSYVKPSATSVPSKVDDSHRTLYGTQLLSRRTRANTINSSPLIPTGSYQRDFIPANYSARKEEPPSHPQMVLSFDNLSLGPRKSEAATSQTHSESTDLNLRKARSYSISDESNSDWIQSIGMKLSSQDSHSMTNIPVSSIQRNLQEMPHCRSSSEQFKSALNSQAFPNDRRSSFTAQGPGRLSSSLSSLSGIQEQELAPNSSAQLTGLRSCAQPIDASTQSNVFHPPLRNLHNSQLTQHRVNAVGQNPIHPPNDVPYNTDRRLSAPMIYGQPHLSRFQTQFKSHLQLAIVPSDATASVSEESYTETSQNQRAYPLPAVQQLHENGIPSSPFSPLFPIHSSQQPLGMPHDSSPIHSERALPFSPKVTSPWSDGYPIRSQAEIDSPTSSRRTYFPFTPPLRTSGPAPAGLAVSIPSYPAIAQYGNGLNTAPVPAPYHPVSSHPFADPMSYWSPGNGAYSLNQQNFPQVVIDTQTVVPSAGTSQGHGQSFGNEQIPSRQKILGENETTSPRKDAQLGEDSITRQS